MTRRPSNFTLLQIGLTASAINLAILAKMHVPGIIGLAALSVIAIAAQIAPAKWAGLWKWALAASALAIAGVWSSLQPMETEHDCELIIAQFALSLFITAHRIGAGKIKSIWNFLGILWAFVSAGILVAVSYRDNLPGQFGLGLAAGLFLLVLCRIIFRLGPLGIQTVNTGILFLIFFPAADLLIRFHSRRDMGANPGNYYTYEAATKNPTAYARWTSYYGEQWSQMMRECMMPDTNGFVTYCFRPDTRGTLFNSVIAINHLGFRGPEIPVEKGNAYRIVCLGESTTFGCTMNRDDRPWPEVLEQMIRERLHPARPVQVINAGIPGAALPGNLKRLLKQILPLQPDMLISYHGYNGFYLLEKGMPPIMAPSAPDYQPRPLKLLADFEHAVKLSLFKRSLRPTVIPERHSPIPPMESDYAIAYQKLIRITTTNHIRLVLANYSMAINTNSDENYIKFYEQTFPGARDAIRVNVLHSEIVRQLASENPEICFVDTHPTLDGKPENFMDLMHFTQPGNQKMAETFFTAITNRLATDLAADHRLQTTDKGQLTTDK